MCVCFLRVSTPAVVAAGRRAGGMMWGGGGGGGPGGGAGGGGGVCGVSRGDVWVVAHQLVAAREGLDQRHLVRLVPFG